MFIIGNIIQITAQTSWVHMMMGRFVAGLGVVSGLLAFLPAMLTTRVIYQSVFQCTNPNALLKRFEVLSSLPTS